MKQIITKSVLKKQLQELEARYRDMSYIATQAIVIHSIYHSAVGELSPKLIKDVSDALQKDSGMKLAKHPAEVFALCKQICDQHLAANPDVPVLKNEEAEQNIDMTPYIQTNSVKI